MKDKKSGNAIGSFSYPNDKEPVIDELRVIAAREGKSQSQLIFSLVEGYVKAHAEGNPSFKLDKWAEDPGFKAMPTLLGKDTSWFEYEKECSEEELTKIAIAANTRLREIRFIRANKNKK
jgi:hypothetical protein